MRKLLLLLAFIVCGTASAQQRQIPISGLPNGVLMQQTDMVPFVRGGVTMQANPYAWPPANQVMVSSGNSAPYGSPYAVVATPNAFVKTNNSGTIDSSFITGGDESPGGTGGQIQYNNSGAFGGFTASGDCTITPSTGVVICLKTNGTVFSPSATTDATNASNISSGTLPTGRLPIPSGAATGAAPNCVGYSSVAACEAALGYADPRLHGGSCLASTFNSNNNVNDDAPALAAAAATGLPVYIPYPGCKIASQIQVTGNGWTFYSSGGTAYNEEVNYDEPYLFVTDQLASTGSSNNCAIDKNGWDNLTFRNIQARANYNNMGTVFHCNSFGGSGTRGPAAFTHFINVSLSNFGAGIGSAMGSVATGSTTCQATGTLGNNVMQIDAEGLWLSSSCAGIIGNLSDVHLNNAYISSMSGPCIAATYGADNAFSNVRCEYSGNDDIASNALAYDGAGIYLSQTLSNKLSNITCDHTYGACLYNNAANTLVDNITSYDADNGGSSVTNQCHFLVGNSGNYMSVNNVNMIKLNVNTPYALCTTGTPDYLTWHGTSAITGTTGYSTGYLNLANSVPHLEFVVPGLTSVHTGDAVVYGASVGTTPAAASDASFDLSRLVKAFLPPNFSTASRPACTSAGNGAIYYDTTLNALQACTGSTGAWGALGGNAISVTSGSASVVINPTPGTGTFTVGNTQLINAQGTATSYTVLSTDATKQVTHAASAAVAVTLPQATTTGFTAGFAYTEVNYGTSAVTITPTTSTIDGASALILYPGESAYITSDGTNYTAFVARTGIADIGATFSISGCSATSATGGAATGTYTSGTTGACTVVITPTEGGQKHGYTCWANDETTPADVQKTTAHSTTTATIAGTTVSGDVISFGCRGY